MMNYVENIKELQVEFPEANALVGNYVATKIEPISINASAISMFKEDTISPSDLSKYND